VKGLSVAVIEAANIVAYAIQEAAAQGNTRPGAVYDSGSDEGFPNEKPDAYG
jgi:hypothetical protein